MCRFLFSATVLAGMWAPFTSGIANELADSTSSESAEQYNSRFSIEGKLEQSATAEWNYDLDDKNGGKLTIEPVIELGVTAEISDNIEGYLNLEFTREVELEEEDGSGRPEDIADEDYERTLKEYKSSLEIDEVYIEFNGFFDIDDVLRKTSLTVGRFKISDEREWYYDKSLDGVMISFELEPIDTQFSFSLSSEELFKSDLLEDGEASDVYNFIAVAEHTPFDDIDLTFSAYAIVRDDRSVDDDGEKNNDSPSFIGLSSTGEFAKQRLKYWTDFAVASGEDSDKTISGFGLDVGLTKYFHARNLPSLTLAYAFGSSEKDVDTDFRQTDLQGNSDKFGGVPSFNYYGELLDPELSNLHILTAGIGFRFSSTASLDFILHHYLQVEAIDELRSVDIKPDPNGTGSTIGSELDVVWGFNLTPSIETEFVLGYFHPGDAFDDSVRDAVLIDASISYEF